MKELQEIFQSDDGTRHVWVDRIHLSFVDLTIEEQHPEEGSEEHQEGRARFRMLVDELEQGVCEPGPVPITVTCFLHMQDGPGRHACTCASTGVMTLTHEEAIALLHRLTYPRRLSLD